MLLSSLSLLLLLQLHMYSCFPHQHNICFLKGLCWLKILAKCVSMFWLSNFCADSRIHVLELLIIIEISSKIRLNRFINLNSTNKTSTIPPHHLPTPTAHSPQPTGPSPLLYPYSLPPSQLCLTKPDGSFGGWMVVVFVFVFHQLNTRQGHLDSEVRKCCYQIALWETLEGIFKICTWCGRVQPTVGNSVIHFL